MCRNIKTLHNFEPPATAEEINAASLQFVRKVSGSTSPSRINAPACDEAVADIARIVGRLLDRLHTAAPPKNRLEEAAKARARAEQRFSKV